MQLTTLAHDLDLYFRVPEVRDEFHWSILYPEADWRAFTDPEFEKYWNGLLVRGTEDVQQAATCVFPSDRLIADLPPGTLLFSEHAADFADEPGFLPLSRVTFEIMRQRGISFYAVHLPLDVHPEVSPSRLCAGGMGVTNLEDFFPVGGLPGGAAVIGDSELSLDELTRRLHAYLGEEVPVQTLRQVHDQAGRVAVAAGGGADPAALQDALARGCTTYVTGNADSRCRLDFLQDILRAFRTRIEQANVNLVDATHYGTEKPPQIAMVQWFRNRGLEARFLADVPR
jgi:putative NIF3 family GTP cyclohydrolase 1 type 2